MRLKKNKPRAEAPAKQAEAPKKASGDAQSTAASPLNSKTEKASSKLKNKNLGEQEVKVEVQDVAKSKTEAETKAERKIEVEETAEARLEALTLKLEALEEEKATLKKQLVEYHSLLQRQQAEFENFRKRVQQEKAELNKYGAEAFLQAFLPLLDNYQKAMDALPEEKKLQSYFEGFQLIKQQFEELVAKHGVRSSTNVGDEFDPLFQEAMTIEEVEAPGPAKETVMEVYQPGFFLYDKVLRNSLVKVKRTLPPEEKKADKAEEADETAPPSTS